MVAALVKLYAAPLESQIFEAFWGDRNRQFEYDPYRIEYKFTTDPKINERLLIVTQNS
jgi:hypothetical protein